MKPLKGKNTESVKLIITNAKIWLYEFFLHVNKKFSMILPRSSKIRLQPL